MNQPYPTFLLLETPSWEYQPGVISTVLLESPDFDVCLKEAERLLVENPQRKLRIAQTMANMYINAKPDYAHG